MSEQRSAATIAEATLRELLAGGVGAPRIRVSAVGVAGGFEVQVCIAEQEGRTLTTTRGSTKRFASLDTLGEALREIGIPVFLVDMQNRTPGRLRPPRPDRAEALRATRTQPQQQRLV